MIQSSLAQTTLLVVCSGFKKGLFETVFQSIYSRLPEREKDDKRYDKRKKYPHNTHPSAPIIQIHVCRTECAVDPVNKFTSLVRAWD